MKRFSITLLFIYIGVMAFANSWNTDFNCEKDIEGANNPPARILKKTANSITFVVDEGLSAPKEELTAFDYDFTTEIIMNRLNIPTDENNIFASSYKDENFCILGEDVFFRCIVDAYADHRPLVISPDMIWLLISQGFARYVNAHPEEMRDKLVKHEGKLTLSVITAQSLLSEDYDWSALFNSFDEEITKNTVSGVAETIVANFSTTTPTERIASQITLMETVKSYFDYLVMYVSCGIPNITLTGTPDDWRLLLKKTKQLGQIGLTSWTQTLTPIIEEFIRASEGKPNRVFWKNMVKRHRVDEIVEGGGCSEEEPTELDGWILSFFPDENGNTEDKATVDTDMPTELVRVGFQYKEIDPSTGSVTLDMPIEMIAGFVGAREDSITKAITPCIGWIIRKDNNEEIALKSLKTQNEQDGIDIEIDEVPEMLKQIPHIKRLTLRFKNNIVLPEWMDEMQIDELSVWGEISNKDKEKLQKRFPQIKFNEFLW